jgi:hypothetical protein
MIGAISSDSTFGFDSCAPAMSLMCYCLADHGPMGIDTAVLCTDWLGSQLPESWQAVSDCFVGGSHRLIESILLVDTDRLSGCS